MIPLPVGVASCHRWVPVSGGLTRAGGPPGSGGAGALHAGVDGSGAIIAHALTDDAPTGLTLIDAVDGDLTSVTADGPASRALVVTVGGVPRILVKSCLRQTAAWAGGRRGRSARCGGGSPDSAGGPRVRPRHVGMGAWVGQGIVRLIRLDPKNLQSRTIRLQVDATRPGRRLGLV